MKKRELFLLALLCGSLSYVACDLFFWTGEIHHGKILTEEIQQIAEDHDTKTKNAPLKEINEDYACWMKIKDLSLSLPVVQGSDDAYYLDHAFDRSENGQGTLFFSASDQPHDPVRIIYGHHVHYDPAAMFSPLLQLKEKQDPVMFSLQYEEYEEQYQISYLFDLAKGSSEFTLQKHAFTSADDFHQWIRYAEENTLIHGREGTENDAYVILQTCGRKKDEFLIAIGIRADMYKVFA
jgi:sortase B